MILNKCDESSLKICAELLKENKILILPTDTVYGFSGVVGKTDEKIRKIKGREENKPFIQLVGKPEDIFLLTDDAVPEKLLSLWPGPLTIIVHKKQNPAETVAVRCPGDEWLRKLIAACGSPVYSTSVNRSGFPVLSKISEIKNEFEKDVDLIVSAGDSESSVPSTIVRLDEGKISVVRKGALDVEKILG